MPNKDGFRFGRRGMSTATAPELLTNGQYRSAKNVYSPQEGIIQARMGRRLIGSLGNGRVLAYKIRKLTVDPTEVSGNPQTNLRYAAAIEGAGLHCNLWRTTDYASWTHVAADISTINTITNRFSMADYSAGSSGNPWAFFACDKAMLKDRGRNPYATLRNWGILPAFGVAKAVDAGAGTLDGGDGASPADSQPYDYRFTYFSSDTSNEGNPSQTMLADSAVSGGVPIGVHLRKATVTVYGTNDPQVDKIRIYRKGGLLFDAWRLVASVANPGIGVAATYTDNIPDVDLQDAPLMELDNDPPVPSTPPAPIAGKFTGPTSAGMQTLSVSAGLAGLAALRPGTLLHFFYDAPEDVTIQSIDPIGGTITAYFQHAHINGADWEVDSITNQPCPLAISYQQFILVAGDPNNPHIITRSKGDHPESFSILPADGSVAQIAAGSPANPIMNFVSFRGMVVCLNRKSIFETLVYNGSLIPAQEVATRGLRSREAWCKTPTEIWFLSDDGVYSWDGGTLLCRSKEIASIFRGESYCNILPIDPASTPIMESHRGAVHLLYMDIAGNNATIVCNPAADGDHWDIQDYSLGSNATAPEYFFQEPDLDNFIVVRGDASNGPTFSLMDVARVVPGSPVVQYTSDDYAADPTTEGSQIPYELVLPWFDLGKPAEQKQFGELYLEVVNHRGTMSLDVFLDYSETAVETITVPVQTGRALVLLALNVVSNKPLGYQARAISFRLFGNSSVGGAITALASLQFIWDLVGTTTLGAPGMWSNLGHPLDKKIYQIVVEFDVSGTDQTLVLDTVSGVNGRTYTEAALSLTLSNPTMAGGGRAIKSFPVAGLIIKEARIRYAKGTQPFTIFGIEFDKELFPPDITSQTPWEDGGYSYLKFANQIVLEANTNNVSVQVKLQADNVDKFSFTIQSTEADRQRTITVPAGLSGYRWRLFCDPAQTAIATGGGCFQRFNHTIVFEQADKGQVGHTFDWDDCGHPWDKRFQVINMEWDNTGGAAETFVMDILKGIDGGTPQAAVATFSLGSNVGRSQKPFDLPDGIIAKKIRIYPQGNTIPAGFKSWKYTPKFEPFPPDVVRFTEPKDFGWPYDKIGSNLILKIDTGGVPASIQPVADGSNVGAPLTVTTTQDDWQRTLPLASDLIGRLWKLRLTPGGGGKTQLFDWNLDFVKEPPAVAFWDSNGLNLGYKPWKYIKRMWLMYVCAVPIAVTITSDTGTITLNLPAHTTRSIEPLNCSSPVWGAGLNKSKIYRIQVASSVSSAPFKLYGSGSGVEFVELGLDRHAGYVQVTFQEMAGLLV